MTPGAQMEAATWCVLASLVLGATAVPHTSTTPTRRRGTMHRVRAVLAPHPVLRKVGSSQRTVPANDRTVAIAGRHLVGYHIAFEGNDDDSLRDDSGSGDDGERLSTCRYCLLTLDSVSSDCHSALLRRSRLAHNTKHRAARNQHGNRKRSCTLDDDNELQDLDSESDDCKLHASAPL